MGRNIACGWVTRSRFYSRGPDRCRHSNRRDHGHHINHFRLAVRYQAGVLHDRLVVESEVLLSGGIG